MVTANKRSEDLQKKLSNIPLIVLFDNNTVGITGYPKESGFLYLVSGQMPVMASQISGYQKEFGLLLTGT